MTSAREEILERLRGHGRQAAAPAQARSVGATSPWPARAALFAASARSASATVALVANEQAVAGEVARYLASERLPPAVCLSADPPGLQAGVCGDLSCERRMPRADGDTLVTACVAAIAEEGAVVLASGARHAAEAAFSAATLVVVATAAEMIDTLEALWPRLRSLGEPLPRMINIVRGPSRTADLGVPSRIGAHGPLRVHVVLVDDPHDPRRTLDSRVAGDNPAVGSHQQA